MPQLTKLPGQLLGQFPRGFYFMAITKYNEGQGEQVGADAASHYLAHNPNDPDAIKLSARIELASRRFPHAIEILNRALDIGQADADILDLLGRAYSLNGQPVQAIQTLQRAAALAPDNAEILTRLASIRMGMGDVSGATSDLEHSLEVAPTGTDAGEVLVTAALASGDLDKAVLALDRLKRLEGDSEAVGNLAGMIKMAQLDLDGARTVLSDAAKRYPQSARTKLNLAKVLIVQNKPKDAEQLLNEVLEHDPANLPWALNALVPIVVARWPGAAGGDGAGNRAQRGAAECCGDADAGRSGDPHQRHQESAGAGQPEPEAAEHQHRAAGHAGTAATDPGADRRGAGQLSADPRPRSRQRGDPPHPGGADAGGERQ